VAGHAEYGSRRWIEFAGMLWQPSEVAKLVTVVLLAKFLADHRDRMDSASTFFISLGIAALPAALVFVEPDLGTSIIFGAIWISLILMSGARKRHLLIVGGLCLALMPFAIALAVNDYQRDRVALFLDPGKEPLERGFNILQAEISIGSGGLVGQGLTHGNQTQLSFLQTKSTDYIFSVLGEELGFVGAMVLFSLYLVLLFRGIRTASRARDVFGRLVATGIVVMITAQVFINVGVNIRLFPVTGIPLPFISQGGTSLLSLFLGIGILQSIAVRERTWTMASFEDRFAT
jgi:rod shape determining protein RodA